jgi:GNAT superfamily N-acetyltransferase
MLARLFARLRRVVQVRRQQFYELTDPGAIVAVAPRAEVAVVDVTAAGVGQAGALRDRATVARFRGFVEEGQRGVYALLDGEVVGHGWAVVCGGDHCRAVGYIDLRRGEACIHFCHVRESHRGKGIYPAMLGALCHRLFEQCGVRRIVVDAALGNTAARRGIEKVGFRPTHRALFVQVCWRLVYSRPLPPGEDG